MFLELFEREEQERHVRIARRAMAIVPMKRGTNTPPTPCRARGVYECEIAQVGHRAFHVVNSKGEIGYIQAPISWVTRGFVRRLMQELDRQDRTQLHVVKPGA